jgi:hypothetical protein
MTADDYRRRIEHAFTAVAFSDDNPFHSSITARLESMGGLHRSPQTADRFTRRDDIKVAHLREVAECKVEGGSPF